MEKPQIHEEICENLNRIYTQKNSDYGDSFAKRRKKYGNVAILIRLEDKFERLYSLLTGETRQVEDETIEDTLSDLANYCIMELVERQIDAEEEEKIQELGE